MLDVARRERDVIALDLPGFGESLPFLGPAPSVPDAGALGRALRRRARASSARTWPATRSAARSRSSSGAWGGALGLRALAGGLRQGLGGAATRSRRCDIARALARALAPAAGVLARSARLRRACLSQLLAHPERVPPAEYAGGARNLGRSPGFRATLRAVRDWSEPDAGPPIVPATIAWGEHDRLLLYRRQSARARAALPAARHVTLAGCGHVPTWDDPEQQRCWPRVLLGARRA